VRGSRYHPWVHLTRYAGQVCAQDRCRGDLETWIDNRSINWVIEAYRSHATSLTGPHDRLKPKELAIITSLPRVSARRRSLTSSEPQSRSSRTIYVSFMRSLVFPIASSLRSIACTINCTKKVPALAPDGDKRFPCIQ
jgi:hypothetical protein